MDRGRAGEFQRFVAVSLRVAIASCVAFLSLLLGAAHESAHGALLPRRVFVPVYTYHHVKWLVPSDNVIERGLTVLPDLFEEELRYLQSAGYHAVTARQVAAYLRGGPRLPVKAASLTFDDGYTDMYRYVYPALRRHHVRATFFIVPGFLDTPRYLTWSQLKDMAAHGMDIEAHTLTHPDLTTVRASQLLHEVMGSRQVLEARLHRPVRLFAYPYGAYDSRVVTAVRRAGYLAAFTTHQGWWQTTNSAFSLPRVYPEHSLAVFRAHLVGIP